MDARHTQQQTRKDTGSDCLGDMSNDQCLDHTHTINACAPLVMVLLPSVSNGVIIKISANVSVVGMHSTDVVYSQW